MRLISFYLLILTIGVPLLFRVTARDELDELEVGKKVKISGRFHMWRKQ